MTFSAIYRPEIYHWKDSGYFLFCPFHVLFHFVLKDDYISASTLPVISSFSRGCAHNVVILVLFEEAKKFFCMFSDETDLVEQRFCR